MSEQLVTMAPSQGCEAIFKRLRDESKDCIRSLRILDVDWPDAIDVIKALCEWVSDAICTTNEKPVLFEAIHRGLKEYSENIQADDYVRLRVFLFAVLDEIGELLHSTVVLNTAKNSTWRPDDNEPFLTWWGNSEAESICLVEGKCSKECVIESIRMAVLTPEQINLLEGE